MNDLLAWELYKKKKKKRKKATPKNKMSISHLVCGQLINICKLGANSNGQDFLNFKHWIFFFIKLFSHFLCI